MGVYINGMKMPESCDMCPIEGCEYINGKFTCPLIEIVHCKDCKWLGVDDGMPFCYWWLREIEPDVFCSYGERRSDE